MIQYALKGCIWNGTKYLNLKKILVFDIFNIIFSGPSIPPGALPFIPRGGIPLWLRTPGVGPYICFVEPLHNRTELECFTHLDKLGLLSGCRHSVSPSPVPITPSSGNVRRCIPDLRGLFQKSLFVKIQNLFFCLWVIKRQTDQGSPLHHLRVC